jgi:sugar/nucleoside kinase (ribokinase family)
MPDIITFGAATQDIYLVSKKFLHLQSKDFINGKGICFNFASKIEIEDVFFSSGGGGTNTAATFSKQGFKVAFCGKIGKDCFANLILNELKELGIGTDFVLKTAEKSTNISIIFSYPGKEKTILAYRGASDILEKKDIPWSKIKYAKWFYLAPFSGKLTNLTEDLVNFARKNHIKVAINPGYSQLTLPKAALERILKKIDVLILNQQEASLLTKIPYQKEKEIFRKLDRSVSGICIMTKGKYGAAVSDGKYIYKASALNMKNVDTTGAGDSFGSGFVCGLMKENNIPYAIQLGMANSGFNLCKLGAKQGLLKKNQPFVKVKVKYSEL